MFGAVRGESHQAQPHGIHGTDRDATQTKGTVQFRFRRFVSDTDQCFDRTHLNTTMAPDATFFPGINDRIATRPSHVASTEKPSKKSGIKIGNNRDASPGCLSVNKPVGISSGTLLCRPDHPLSHCSVNEREETVGHEQLSGSDTVEPFLGQNGFQRSVNPSGTETDGRQHERGRPVNPRQAEREIADEFRQGETMRRKRDGENRVRVDHGRVRFFERPQFDLHPAGTKLVRQRNRCKKRVSGTGKPIKMDITSDKTGSRGIFHGGKGFRL